MVPKEEARKGGDRLMPLFIDHHRGVEGLTAEAVADAHRKDKQIQDQYGVKYLKYWFNEKTDEVFCLADAPNKEAAEAVHREAHGLMADEITEVEMVAVAEGTDKSTPKQEDAARKPMRQSGSLQRTQQRKAWTRRDPGGMTLRNWLPIVGALLVSLVIALGIWGITWQLEKLENQRAEAERKLAERRAQDEALQAYLDQMSQLILDRKLLEVEQGGPVHEPGDPVHTLAQARTSTAILRLDAEHNESVTHFLITSDLSVRSKDSARLLRGSTLSHAKLSGAHLPNADLGDAELSGADLSNALLDNADLIAHLANADLSGASLIGADLSDGNLFSADLSDANLIGADLSRAVLDNANLSNADLENANLGGANGITNAELEQQAVSLEGVDMPNGQKYEDWLKSELREEDRTNEGFS